MWLFITDADENDPWLKRIPPAGWIITLAVLGLFAYGFFFAPEPSPPSFIGTDWQPEKQILCPSSELEPADLARLNYEAVELGWPKWPGPIQGSEADCHREAEPGEVLWKGCAMRSSESGIISPACPVGPDGEIRKGAAYVHVVDGQIQHATIYTDSDSLRTARHERWHAAGIIDMDFDPTSPDNMSAAHTVASDHVMNASGTGSSIRWLDRTEGGDWPYHEEPEEESEAEPQEAAEDVDEEEAPAGHSEEQEP